MKGSFCDPKTEFITFALCSIKYTNCVYPQMLTSVTF